MDKFLKKEEKNLEPDKKFRIKLQLSKKDKLIGKKKIKYIFDNIVAICNKHQKKGRYWLKENEIREHYKILKDKSSLLIIHKFIRPIPKSEKYYKRLVKEFHLIREKNFTKVFLQVRLILDLIDTNILHIIRGSSGSSLVCYLLGITDIDPIKEKISLARFMHEKREDIPDIDMDFPAHIRTQIFKKLYQNWEGRIARISNNVTFGYKSALREAVRKFGYNKFLPRDFDIHDIFDDDKVEKVIEYAREIEGTTRTKSLHCGGIVIFEKAVPKNLFLKSLEVDDIKGAQIKLDKDEVEDNGLIKIDILSNRGLSQLMAIDGRQFSEYDYFDEKVWDFISTGQNLGYTHGESRAMSKVFIILKPHCIAELASCLALIRPAASGNGQKSAFLRDYDIIKNDSEKFKDFIIFDDDAIQYISRIIKTDESNGDRFRRAFAKKKYDEKFLFKRLLKSKNPGFSKEKINLIMENLTCLENYSFCKSHAYSYARLIYCLAYHKLYNPKKFWLATINNCNSSYRSWVHMRQCVTAGIKLNYGRRPWRLKGDKLISAKSGTKLKEDNVRDYFREGYWMSDEFLKGMYFREKTVEKKKNGEKIEVKMGYFRGVIAIYRSFYHKKKKRYKVSVNGGEYISQQEKYSDKNRVVTFVTVGYDNDKFYDLVIWGRYNFSRIHCIEGYGQLNDLKGYPWISVSKFWVSYIKN